MSLSFQSQIIGVPSSNVVPPPDPDIIFELNQARRAKVTGQVEYLRGGACLSVPNGFRETLTLIKTPCSIP